MSEENDVKKMTPDEELKVYLLYKEDRTNADIIKLTTRPDGHAWSLSKIVKLKARFKKGYIPTVEEPTATPEVSSEVESLSDFDAEKSMSRSFKMATRLLERALIDAENGYEIEDEMRRRVPIKTIMECIEKAGRYWSSYQKTRKGSGAAGEVNINYREMAQIYMETKDKGIKYDAKGHMRAVLEEANKQANDVDEIDEQA